MEEVEAVDNDDDDDDDAEERVDNRRDGDGLPSQLLLTVS